DRRWLRGAATGRTSAGRFWSGRRPKLFARADFQRDESASDVRLAGSEIGNADVCNALVVQRSSPHRSTVDAACSDLCFPNEFSFTVWIDAVDHSGFVAR